MQNVAQRLQAIDLKLKRWQTRLTRAHNAIVKLNQQRKRLTNPKLMADYDNFVARKNTPGYSKTNPNPVQPPVITADDPDLVEKVAAALDQKKDDLAIPALLLRTKTKQGTPEQRKAMPLSDRKAMEFIKAQSAKVTAKRAKRELRINK